MADRPQPPAQLPGQDLFVDDLGEDPFFVSVEPREIAFFAGVPTSELIDYAQRATKRSPRTSVIEDHYYDTRDGTMASAGCSVRLRRYLEPPTDLSFEVIWVAWKTPGDSGSRNTAASVRANEVVVQSFRASSDSDFREHAKTLARRGFEEILRVKKTRHKFEMEPLSIHEVISRGLPKLLANRPPQRQLPKSARHGATCPGGSARASPDGIHLDRRDRVRDTARAKRPPTR